MALRPLRDRQLGRRASGGLRFLGTTTTPAPTSMFTDFSTVTVGTMPAGFSDKFVAVTWSVATDATAVGGRLLQAVTGSTARRAVGWDAASGGSADQEVVARMKSSSVSIGTLGPAVMARGAGAAGSERGYAAGVFGGGTPELRLFVFDGAGGSFSIGSATNPGWAVNAYFWVRLRCSGSNIKARAWMDGASEPGTWGIDTTNTVSPSAGWPGLYTGRNATQSLDVIGVAYDGASAPTA